LVSILDCRTASDYDDLSVRVLVADDGSEPDLLRQNKEICSELGVEILHGHGRTGIAKTWNRLVRHAPETEVIALVNDDIEVVPHWLDVISYSLLNNSQAGMVGLNTYCGVTKGQIAAQMAVVPRIDYHESRLMGGCGTLVSSHGPIFGFLRSSYDLVGGFDERYFCFYEEVDFGVALRRKGFYHYMASYPLCYHMGGATNSDKKNLDASRLLVESRNKFFEKWGKSIGQFREEFRDVKMPLLHEWNTQIKAWK
jgi:GT2 family glycosyltransferase